MTHDGILKRPECGEILAETRRREHLVETEPEPKLKWDREPWLLRRAYGPEWSANWFAAEGQDMPDTVAQRYRRALRQLLAAGLVETFARWGTRTTNVALTESGTELAEQIITEAGIQSGKTNTEAANAK